MVNRVRISCSHCHELNDAGTLFCQNCGHCADRPRMACICPQCVGPAVRLRLRRAIEKGPGFTGHKKE